MARDLVATWLDIDPDEVEIAVQVELPQHVSEHLQSAQQHADEAARAQAEAAAERRLAARELKSAGLTVRDIGHALGVSHQRAQQLIAG